MVRIMYVQTYWWSALIAYKLCFKNLQTSLNISTLTLYFFYCSLFCGGGGCDFINLIPLFAILGGVYLGGVYTLGNVGVKRCERLDT